MDWGPGTQVANLGFRISILSCIFSSSRFRNSVMQSCSQAVLNEVKSRISSIVSRISVPPFSHFRIFSISPSPITVHYSRISSLGSRVSNFSHSLFTYSESRVSDFGSRITCHRFSVEYASAFLASSSRGISSNRLFLHSV